MYIYVYLKCYKNWSSLVIEVNFNEIESIFISNYQVSIEKVVKLYFIDVETWKTIVNLQQIYADNSRSREGFIRVKLGQSGFGHDLRGKCGVPKFSEFASSRGKWNGMIIFRQSGYLVLSRMKIRVQSKREQK